MNEQVHFVANKISKGTGVLHKLRDYLSSSCLRKLYYALLILILVTVLWLGWIHLKRISCAFYVCKKKPWDLFFISLLLNTVYLFLNLQRSCLLMSLFTLEAEFGYLKIRIITVFFNTTLIYIIITQEVQLIVTPALAALK